MVFGSLSRTIGRRRSPEVVKLMNDDVPVTASNAGDRTVSVKVNQTVLPIPVHVDTTPNDLLDTAAVMTNIDPSRCVVMERFGLLRLERRLRRYEKIRDVMNSWQHDRENILYVVPYNPQETDVSDLELRNAPPLHAQPGGFSLVLYHSEKLGSWSSKVYINLLQDGRLYLSKKSEVQITDKKHARSLCHLNDFDIYSPLDEEKTMKLLKPPKSACFAVKSQQKMTLFPNYKNYVHYFSGSSREMEKFHDAIHAWRSWHLAQLVKPMDDRDEVEVETEKKTNHHVENESVGLMEIQRTIDLVGRKSYTPPLSNDQGSINQNVDPNVATARDDAYLALVGGTPEKDGARQQRSPPQVRHNTTASSSSTPLANATALQQGASKRRPSQTSQERNLNMKKPLVHDLFTPEFEEGGLLGKAYDMRKQALEVTNFGFNSDGAPERYGRQTTQPSQPSQSTIPRTRSISRSASTRRPHQPLITDLEQENEFDPNSLLGTKYKLLKLASEEIERNQNAISSGGPPYTKLTGVNHPPITSNNATQGPRRNVSTRSSQPRSRPSTATNDGPLIQNLYDDPFDRGGLLGKTYDEALVVANASSTTHNNSNNHDPVSQPSRTPQRVYTDPGRAEPKPPPSSMERSKSSRTPTHTATTPQPPTEPIPPSSPTYTNVPTPSRYRSVRRNGPNSAKASATLPPPALPNQLLPDGQIYGSPSSQSAIPPPSMPATNIYQRPQHHHQSPPHQERTLLQFGDDDPIDKTGLLGATYDNLKQQVNSAQHGAPMTGNHHTGVDLNDTQLKQHQQNVRIPSASLQRFNTTRSRSGRQPFPASPEPPLPIRRDTIPPSNGHYSSAPNGNGPLLEFGAGAGAPLSDGATGGRNVERSISQRYRIQVPAHRRPDQYGHGVQAPKGMPLISVVGSKSMYAQNDNGGSVTDSGYSSRRGLEDVPLTEGSLLAQQQAMGRM